MLIDDNEDDNFFHHLIIKEAQVAETIKIVESGFEALDFLKSHIPNPELIFLDINMPKMNGWEFLEEYEKIDAKYRAEAVIVMLTTSLNPTDKEKAHSQKIINDFESKPLTEEMLFKILNKYFPDRYSL